MTRIPVSTFNERSIYASLELSKNSWLLAIQLPGRDNPSLHPVKGGDADGLMAKLGAARERVAKVTGQTPTVIWRAMSPNRPDQQGSAESSRLHYGARAAG